MKEDKVINKESRKITTSYTLENGYRVKVSTYHVSQAKAIRSILSECIARQSGIFTMETSMMFQDLSERVLSEPASRYSFNALEDQHERAIKQVAQTVALLLAQGEAGERECQIRELANA